MSVDVLAVLALDDHVGVGIVFEAFSNLFDDVLMEITGMNP